MTPPSTDTVFAGSTGMDGGSRIVLAGLGLLIAVAMIFTQPVRPRSKR